jgi:hypothetical protein
MSESQVAIYFAIVFAAALYVFIKAGLNKLTLLVVLIFWSGLFQYLGNITNSEIENIYKVIMTGYALMLAYPKIIKAYGKSEKVVNMLFLLFSFSFWISYLLSGGGIVTILSQYLYKYGFVFILYHYVKSIEFNIPQRERLKQVLLVVLHVQIALSIIKITFVGFGYEPIVGSISAGGAGSAVVIPIVALIFYWLICGRRFTKREWVVAILFFTLSLASGKRQPIIIFPIILFALFFFVNKSIRLFTVLKYLPIALIVFYLGVRLTPTFTPEGRPWGSFDLNYVKEYSLSYYFGVSDLEMVLSDQYDHSVGRGGGLIYYFNPEMLNLHTFEEKFFGKGRYEVATRAHGRFTATGRSDYGIAHQGLMGEAGAMLYSFGYIGTLLMVFLAAAIILIARNKKLAIVILLYFLWDFLFYYNQVVYSNTGALIVLFIVFYSIPTDKNRNASIKKKGEADLLPQPSN